MRTLGCLDYFKGTLVFLVHDAVGNQVGEKVQLNSGFGLLQPLHNLE